MITEYVLFDLPAGISREEAGAFYLWTDRASAEAAHDEAWRHRIRTAYGSEPRVRYFDTPLVLDNALGRLVESHD